jgi:hypothetical protein
MSSAYPCKLQSSVDPDVNQWLVDLCNEKRVPMSILLRLLLGDLYDKHQQRVAKKAAAGQQLLTE